MGYPDAAGLVEAVEAFLREVEGKLDGRDAFHAKVAGNILAIVARELRAGSGSGLEAELAARIRSGALDAGTPGLLNALLDAAALQLEIDNPRYATLERLRRARG